jgi:hypothetical protein
MRRAVARLQLLAEEFGVKEILDFVEFSGE